MAIQVHRPLIDLDFGYAGQYGYRNVRRAARPGSVTLTGHCGTLVGVTVHRQRSEALCGLCGPLDSARNRANHLRRSAAMRGGAR